MLLASHRHRLGREDLEDCYSQATLELLRRSQHGKSFAGHAHIANALEQRLLSRIHDRRRALSGRSPIETVLARAVPVDREHEQPLEVADQRADVERLAIAREQLGLIGTLVRQLSRDQQLVMARRLSGTLDHREFCRQHGWSLQKYRKVDQRARARLRRLLADTAR